MKTKKLVSLLLVTAMTAGVFAGCGNDAQTGGNAAGDTGTAAGAAGGTAEGNGEIKEFTAFFAVPGSEINDDNELQQKIAEITGAKCKETWLTGQKAQEAVGTLIAGGE